MTANSLADLDGMIWDALQADINAKTEPIIDAVIARLLASKKDIEAALRSLLRAEVASLRRGIVRQREQEAEGAAKERADAEKERIRREEVLDPANWKEPPYRKRRDMYRWLDSEAGRAWLATENGQTWEEKERKYQAQEAELERNHHQEMGRLIKQYAATVRLELLDSLLEAEFALGDGRRVTWGNATIADHEERIAMLSKHAQGTMETAARHLQAIEMLREQSVKTLAELKQAPAPIPVSSKK